MMLPGINHNFKYNDMLFHIQTEDTGTTTCQIVTHLYIKGIILSSKKMSYADAKSCTELPEMVKELMEIQHRKMLLELSKGVHDAKIKDIMNG